MCSCCVCVCVSRTHVGACRRDDYIRSLGMKRKVCFQLINHVAGHPSRYSCWQSSPMQHKTYKN